MTPWAIRAARPEDTPGIGKLFVGTDGADLDWTRPEIASWWLVAEREGEIVGAIQVTCSRPVGYIGDLAVLPSERGKGTDGRGSLSPRAGAVALALFAAAEAVMRRHGVERITAVLKPSRGWRRIVERWGASRFVEGATLARKDLR